MARLAHRGYVQVPQGAETEVRRALGNGFKLSMALVASVTVATVVRLWIPRYLEPARFGTLHFAERLAMGCFMLLTLGVATYLRKEVSVHPERTSRLFGALTTLRGLGSIAMALLMGGVLLAMREPIGVWVLAFTFAAGHFIVITNDSLGAILEASGPVGVLGLCRAGGKLLWGVLSIVGLMATGELLVVPLAFCLVELAKLPILAHQCSRHAGLRPVVGLGSSGTMLAAVLPFAISSLSRSVYANVDVTMLAALSTDREVGWYGAATNVLFALMLIMPVLQAVVIPMGSRLAMHPENVLTDTMRSAVRICLILLSPLAALVVLNAPDIVGSLYGSQYMPAVGALTLLGPAVPITYTCTLASIHLIHIGRVWTLARISLLALALNPTINALLIPLAARTWGPGGPSMAAALATTLTECVVLLCCSMALGRRLLDGALGNLVARLVASCGFLFAVHSATRDLGAWRIFTDAAAYLAMATPLGLVPWSLCGLILRRIRRAAGTAVH